MKDYMSVETLEERLSKNPKSLLFARLADHYLHHGRIDEAIDLCLTGTQHHPSYITGYYVLAKAYATKDDFENAESALKKVLAHDRQHLSSQKMLGDLMTRNGWENKAAIHYRDILNIDPMLDEIRIMLTRLTGEKAVPNNNKSALLTSTDPADTMDEGSKTTPADQWDEQLESIFPDDKHLSPESGEDFTNDISDVTEPEDFAVKILNSERAPEGQSDTTGEGLQGDTADDDIQLNEIGFGDDELQSFADELDNIKLESDKLPNADNDVEHQSVSEDETVGPSVNFGSLTEEFNDINRSSDGYEKKEKDQSEDDTGPVIINGKNIETLADELENFKLSLDDSVAHSDSEEEADVDEDPGPSIPDEFELNNTMAFTSGHKDTDDEADEFIKSGEDLPPLAFDNGQSDSPPSNGHQPLKPEPGTEGDPDDDKNGSTPLSPPSLGNTLDENYLEEMPQIQKPSMLSPTLGEIYAAQGQYSKAIAVYEQLLQKYPGEEKYIRKIKELKKKLDEVT